MKESKVIVQRIRLLDGGDYQRIELAVEKPLYDVQMGQCLLVRPKSMRKPRIWHPYLRNVWYPVYSNPSMLTVEVHTTERLAPGDVLDVVGPVGRAYVTKPTLRHVLLVAYDTLPSPLMSLITNLLVKRVAITLVLLGTAAQYPTKHLPPEVEVIRGDDPDQPLEWHNQVTTIGLADQTFVVVPLVDELNHFRAVWELFKSRRADIPQRYLYGVFQSVLPCGVGACDACLIKTKEGYKHVCVDGPALDLTTIF